MEYRPPMIWVLITFVAEVLGIISAVHAVMHARTSQGAIAWLISLIIFPILALPAYWIFGRSQFAGYVTAKKLSENEMREQHDELLQALAPHVFPQEELSGVGRAIQSLADLPLLGDNEADLLIDGTAAFDSIRQGIAEAKQYILFQFFIVHDDELGRSLKEVLIARAREGVRVFFLYDEIGSHKLPAGYKRNLTEAGIAVSAFNTRKGRRNRFQINFRNHRKIVVVDGDRAWIGGHNVGDEYLGKDPKFGHWRDTHMRIRGPAAIAAQVAFVVDWYWATDREPGGLNWMPAAGSSDKQILVLPTGPADAYETATLMFLHSINSAKERIWIASPYFVPDDTIINALQLAALRGVDVRVLIPDSPDHMMVYLAAFSYHEAATVTGVKIYRYTNGFLHAKTMLIDDKASAIGTANLDNRSLRLNFEVTAFVIDEAFAKENEQMFEADFANARLMTDADLYGRPFWFRFAVRFARLLSPIL
jgi:cardiolipin synthase